MKFYRLIFCAPLLAMVPVAGHAQSTTDQRIAHLERQLRELRMEHAQNRHVGAVPIYPKGEPVYTRAEPIYTKGEPVVYVPPVERVYNWTGVHVGVFGGLSGGLGNPMLQIPTFGTLQGNNVGFAANPNLTNSVSVDSQVYNDHANGATYSTYSLPTAATNFGGGAGTVIDTGYNNLPGSRTDSQVTTRFDPRKLIGTLGGEIGYRRQFGMFVLGVEADGSFMDGMKTDTTNSQGQFSNTQGIRGTAIADLCTSNDGGDPATCTSSVVASSSGSVNVENNGHSSSSLTIKAGPSWLATARLTGGIAMDRVMFYGTGGLAYAQSSINVSAKYNDTVNSTCSGIQASEAGTAGVGAGGETTGGTGSVNYTCNGVTNAGSSYTYTNSARWAGSRSAWMPGFAVGSGVAYAATDNVILKLEGLYYNVGTLHTTVTGTGTRTQTGDTPNAAPALPTPTSVTSFTASQKIDGFIAKLSLEYAFE